MAALREQGWIESQQGKGRFVRGRPAMATVESNRTGQAYLTNLETDSPDELVEAGAVALRNRVAALLNAEPKSKAYLRRRLVVREDEPSALVSLWLPLELSEGTDLTSGEALPQGIRQHLQSRKGVRFDHIVEQITARMPTAQEAKQLGMPKNVPLLAIFGAVRDASGRPSTAADYCCRRIVTSWRTPTRCGESPIIARPGEAPRACVYIQRQSQFQPWES
ncbi:GntR family transcriptional regulator [Nonomuraea sp. NPDC050691]|uniref:GntR family transcriptional regulator n=1 Tax=Nonomuraea sp. NPDC050691 TaxID=3155661 RepID=UPI0033F0BD35